MKLGKDENSNNDHESQKQILDTSSQLWDIMCAYQGVRNVRFSENLACFVFLKHPFWDLPFCLIANENKFTEAKQFTCLNEIS